MAYNFKNISVLIVDDDSSMRLLLSNVFQRLKAKRHDVVASAETALEYLQNNRYDVVITDYSLGATDGIEFTKTLRKRNKENSDLIPVMMVSGHIDAPLLKRALDAGVSEFLAKPFSLNDLANRMAYIFKNPRQCINIEGYYGPDRRRKQHPNFKGPFKRETDV